MNGTLDDAVARAQAREARESNRVGQDVQSFHLGGPPEPWETALGDTGERVGLQGRAVLEYAAKMNAMGINERSLAGENNPIADHVVRLGQDKMRLLSSNPVASTPVVMNLEGETSPESIGKKDEDAISASSDWSDISDENEAVPGQAQKDAAAATAAGSFDPGENDDEPSDGLDLIDDPDIRNAIEDFDSRNWTMDQLEVSCQTLLEECYASETRRRRLLSAGMLRKLVEIYPSALRWLQRNLEAVVNDGLPSMVKGVLDERVFKLDILLGILAPTMAESMTQLNVVARVLRLMLFRMDTAVRVIAFRYAYPRWLAKYRELPGAIAIHKRMTLLMQGAELRARWRRIKLDEKHGSLPPSLLHAYLCIVLALIDTETCPRLCRMNRVKVVGAGGVMALSVHFKAGDRSQRLACRILRELAREPLLIYELLIAGVAEYLSRLLPKVRETSIDRMLEALDAVDSMAFSAMRFCELSYAHPNRGQGNSALVDALVADGSDIGGLESEIRLPSGDKVEEIVRAQLGLPNLVAILTGLLGETDVQLFLAGVVILGKLATTVCYHSVLQEMLAYAGRALEMLVQGVQSQEEIVPDMSVALFLQLCSRQEGRDGIEATDGVTMLRPLISGGRAQSSPVFLRGLTCALAIARQGVPGSAPGSTGEGTTPSATAPPGMSLPRAGGVGRSGPPKPHPLDFEGKLYNDLVDILDAPPPAPLNAVRGLVRMGSLEPVMRFLVRDDDGEEEGGADDDGSVSLPGGTGRNRKKPAARGRCPHYFRLKQRHACLGVVALHGLAVLAGPHPAIMTESTLRYLCYSIQVAYIDLTVGTLAPGMGYSLMFRSIQLACRALAFLATSGGKSTAPVGVRDGNGRAIETRHRDADENQDGAVVDHGPLRRVADSLLSTTAINEVACIAQMPSRAAWAGDEGFIYRHLERTVSSAAILVAGVCPVPAAERDPFTRFDEPEDEPLSLHVCQPLMERLVTTVGGALCSTLMVAESLEIIAHTCRALAKLSDTNTTVQMLLDTHDIMKAVIRLCPRAPTVLPVAVHPEGEEALSGGSSPPNQLTRAAHGVVGSRATNRETPKRAKSFDSKRREEFDLDELGQTTAAAMKETRVADIDESCGEGREHESGESRGRVGRRKESGDCSGNGASRSVAQPPWSGYHVREGEIADASTRKLCSLPFDYFRLVANIARVPSGRAIVQSSGTLKRCLERLALDVSGCPAARLATLRCRSEICVLIGRMAGTYDRKTGTANELILYPRYQTLRVLLGMLATPPENGKPFGASLMQMELARHNAAYALGEICKDTLRSVPLVADSGGVHLACTVVNNATSPMPLLKQVLRVLHGAGSFPDGRYASCIADPKVLRSLNRIANNAYPGFRPSQPSDRNAGASSSISARNKAQTPPPLRDGSGRTVNTRERVPLEVAFNLVKPRSPESRLISDLATEVAYLVGTRTSECRSPTIPASPPGPKEPAATGEQQQRSFPAKAVQVRHGTGQGAEDKGRHVCPTSPTNDVEMGGWHAGVEKMPDNVPTPVILANGAASGRPGTYSGCGVTSCAGLGFTGEHGDAVGNVPHAAFVLRKDDSGNRDGKSAACGRGRKQAPGASLSSDGSCAPVHRLLSTEDARSPIAQSPTVGVVATPLALLSAREESLRNELIRRKAHYGLGGTNQGDTRGEGEGAESSHAPATLAQDSGYRGPSAIVERGRSTEAPQRSRSSIRTSRRKSPVPVDIAKSPLMASTRPSGLPPGLESRPVPQSMADPGCKYGVNVQEWKDTALALGSKCAPSGGKELVVFARPAAHWSVTNSLSQSPGRARSKGIRVPASSVRDVVGVVGRYASRGYLLDPTFQDHNPVILHPRLPRISGGGFSQVPDDSTLAEIVTPAANGGAKEIEPYRNIVEVLRHSVGVSGVRKAGKQRYFDEPGLPLSPGNL